MSYHFPCCVANGVEVLTGMKSCGGVRVSMQKLFKIFFLLFFVGKVFSEVSGFSNKYLVFLIRIAKHFLCFLEKETIYGDTVKQYIFK